MTTIVLTANTESALQKALNTANAGDIITFSTAGVITLTQTLVISNSITIDGLVGSSSTVTLQGNGGFTDVEVISGTVTLSNLSITMGSGTGFSGTNGTASSVQGGNGGDAAGGVFIYGGQVTINSVGFSNDTAIGGNGGNGYSWADFSGQGGGGGGAGGNAAGAVFAEAGSVTFTGTSTFASDTATGGDGGAGGIGAGAYLDTSGNSPSSSYGGFGGSAGTGVANATGNAGVDGQAGNALGGTTGANGGTGGIPGAAGSAGSAGTGQNSLGGGGGGGGGGGTGYATIGASQNATIVPCFASGVRILTPSGYVPVEDLVEGGRVVTVSGATRPIIWLGHRRLDLTTHAAPESVQPICVQAHAFGPNLPLRPVTPVRRARGLYAGRPGAGVSPGQRQHHSADPDA